VSTISRLYRWALILQSFQLEVLHIRGSLNRIADFLSRKGRRMEDNLSIPKFVFQKQKDGYRAGKFVFQKQKDGYRAGNLMLLNGEKLNTLDNLLNSSEANALELLQSPFGYRVLPVSK